MSNDSRNIDKYHVYLINLEKSLVKRYDKYVSLAQQKKCKVNKCSISSLDFVAFNVSFSVLKEAISEIKMDIKILLLRRNKLIAHLRASEGKIAGIILYRLAKAHIIHSSGFCNNCGKKCLTQLNMTIAIRIGLDYIHKKYNELPEGIRQELGYTIKHRHVNQEMLGLTLDALGEEYDHANNTKKIIK